MDNFLIKQEAYLEAGIHIGTKLKVVDMNQFIYRMRNDGLYVLDLRKIDERIRLAGKMLSQYAPEEILVVASRTYSGNAASVFSQLTGIRIFQGRFIPGILTNVSRSDFTEPKLLLVCDPKGERQAVIEAGRMGIATIGLCDSDNSTMFIDWVVPCNNKGRRSLALIFYLLTREYLMGRNRIASYDEFSTPLSSFEADAAEPAEKTTSPASEKPGEEAAAPAAEPPQPSEPAAQEAAPSEEAPAPETLSGEHKKAEHKKKPEHEVERKKEHAQPEEKREHSHPHEKKEGEREHKEEQPHPHEKKHEHEKKEEEKPAE